MCVASGGRRVNGSLLSRRTLPMVALISSLLIFLGAVAFGLRAQSGGANPTATPPSATAIAISAPTAVPTGTATASPAAASPTPTPAAAASAARPSSPTVAIPGAVTGTAAPTATTAVVGGALPTPTIAVPLPVVQPTPTPQPPAPPSSAPQPVVPPTPTRAPPVPPAPPPSVAPPVPTPTPVRPTATRPPAPPVTGQVPSNVGVPVRLRIPSLGIDAAIEQVGVDADGNMATPEDPWNTAWYAPGARPGQPGNAAIAGHVDYHDIGEVVFWDLNKLQPGAEVLVETANGQTLRFVVQDSTYFRPDSAPLQRIFGAANTRNLNLITCGGTFNATTRQYDQRLVVFTTYAGQ